MTRILENRDSHSLVQHDDGSVELVPWSPMNQLVYKHGLHGVLREGNEIFTVKTDDGMPDLTITPLDDATEFKIEYGDDTVHVDKHEKSDFVDALLDAADSDTDGLDHRPILDFASDLFDTDVNPAMVDQAAQALDGDIEVTDKGWLINDVVLLTYDNEFYHPGTTAVNSRGETLGANASQLAYELRFQGEGQTDWDDWESLADMGTQAEFLARAMWALKYAPEEVEAVG